VIVSRLVSQPLTWKELTWLESALPVEVELKERESGIWEVAQTTSGPLTEHSESAPELAAWNS